MFCTLCLLERLGGLARSPVVFPIFVASFISSPSLIQALIHGKVQTSPLNVQRIGAVRGLSPGFGERLGMAIGRVILPG